MTLLKPASFVRWLGAVLTLTLITAASTWVIQGQTGPRTRILARGAGTTMLEGGSGDPDYMPVLTKIAFHVEEVDGVITGAFECLALAPKEMKGAASGEFTQNVMYVTGAVESAVIEGDTIRLSGNSECTGIGAGSNVPFTCTIRKGGPGATLILRGGFPQAIYKEILLEGNFEVLGEK
ncbi:MAG TPA: hypothetical protein VM120_19620 [Bryobacteraceae bacterium]|nr:hypothetical protein [Bryobacteraceae bacterium]